MTREALALIAGLCGGLPPLGPEPAPDRKTDGECPCGGTYVVTPVSGKSRCDRCRKLKPLPRVVTSM